MTEITLSLPWPPTANTYWRRKGNVYFITGKGQEFRDYTYYKCIKLQKSFTQFERLSLEVNAYPPDKRRRDLDNLFKCLLDSLQKALIFPDDSQIDCLLITRMPLLLDKVDIKIKTL